MRQLLAIALAATGCATVSKERGHAEVADWVQQRSGHRTRWERGTPEDEQIQRWVDQLLEGGLTRRNAIEIALVNSPSLRQTYEELGISQAEMVQAGLLENPSIGASYGIPEQGGVPEYEVSIAQQFLDLFVLPLRKEIAEAQFTADAMRVAHQALEVAAGVAMEVASAQAAQKKVELRRTVVDGARAAAELAESQHRAGNITDLQLATQRAAFQQAKLELAREELELLEHRERLNRMLGLWGPRTEWKLAEALPELPAEEPPLDRLESMAMRQRLDIEAARRRVALLQKGVDLARTTRWFGRIEVGLHTHQDPNGPHLHGPNLVLELPIFDQRQAYIARLEAEKRQMEARLSELAIDARSHVRLARARLAAQRQVVEHYRTGLLPLRERIVQESLLHYNAMQLGPLELVEARQAQVDAYRDYLDAVRDYWIARAELERAVGGRLTSEERHEH